MKKKHSPVFLSVLVLFLFFKKSNAQIITLFSEDFSTSSFATNGWTFPNGQGNWLIGSSSTPAGAVAPNAFFNWATSASNYSTALLSNTINATSITGPVTLDYLLLFNPYSTATLEQFKVEYKDVASSTWTLLANYTNSVTSMTTWTVLNMSLPGVTGQNFQIKFTAYGVSSFNITRWSLDNIVVKGTSCLSSLPALTITSTPTICAGKSATLTALGGGTSYTWTPAGGNSSVAIVSPTINTTYALVSSMPGCSVSPVSAITTVTVLTNTTSLTTTSSASVICAGNTVTLTAAGATSYSWSTGVSTTSITVSPSVSSVYSVSNTNSLGCVAVKTISVNVNPNPIVTAFSTSSLICSGGVNNLIASGAITYSWSNGATTGIITVTPQTSTVYTLTGVDSQGCSSTGTINVAVSSPVTLVANTASICSGSSAFLTAGGATTYTWSNSASGNSISVNPLTTTIYSVSATNSIGCVTSASIGISVNPNPTVNVVSSASAICLGSTATLTANGAATYTWSNAISGINTTISPLVNTVYTVSGISSAGCTGVNSTATLGIVVNSNPTITVSASASLLCSGQTLSLSSSGAATYSWNFGATGSTATVLTTGTSTYSVVGTNTQTCSSTATVAITVLPSPSITIAGSSTAICVGDTVSLLANGALTYTWNTGSTVNVIYVTPTTSTNYTISGAGSNNCIGTKTVGIIVNMYPVLTLSSSDSLICSGESVNLSVNGALTYSWSNAMTGSMITVSPAFTSTYTVEGSNNGCNANDMIIQYVDECVGLDKYSSTENPFVLYPNPGNGYVRICLQLLDQNAHLEVYAAVGQLILFEKMKEDVFLVDLSEEPAGVYYFKISNGDKQSVIKYIKE